MKERKYCNPEDMIMFLLAVCCRGDLLANPARSDKDLNKSFHDCRKSVIPIAKSAALKQKLKS
jgi:hypothetical protein